MVSNCFIGLLELPGMAYKTRLYGSGEKKLKQLYYFRHDALKLKYSLCNNLMELCRLACMTEI